MIKQKCITCRKEFVDFNPGISIEEYYSECEKCFQDRTIIRPFCSEVEQ